MSDMTIKEEFKGVGYEKLPAIGLMAPKMMEFMLTMKSMGFSINAIRIVLILSANLKEKQMSLRKKPTNEQLKLFDNEWLDVDNDTNYSAQFNFKFKDFLPKGSKNYGLVKKGLDELQEKNYLIEFSKVDDHGRARKYQLKSALISSYLMEEGNGFKMIINNYWYRALIDVSESFNTYFKPIIFNLNLNSTILYLYLKTLPFIKGQEYEDVKNELGHTILGARGTRIKVENFVKMFDLNFKYDSDIKRKLLDPIKNELNEFGDISYGYKIEDGKITLVTYEMQKNLVENKVLDVEEARIKSAVSYKYKNNALSNTEAMVLLEVYLKYTYSVVLKATERKSQLRGLKGDTYLELFIKMVENHCVTNKINLEKIAYKNIAELRTTLRKGYISK